MAERFKNMKLHGPGGKKYDRARLDCTSCGDEFYVSKSRVGHADRRCLSCFTQTAPVSSQAQAYNKTTQLLRNLGFVA